MEHQNPDQAPAAATVTGDDDARKFMTWVFVWMFFALAISSACIYAFNTFDYCSNLLFVKDTPTALFYIALIGPFILSFIIRKRINGISYAGLCILFVIYAALVGTCFSFILVIFTDSPTLAIFLAACLAFGLMAVIGFFTKTDLTQTRPILTFMLAGLVFVAPLVFLFPRLDMSFWFSLAGVVVFLGLSAFHFQDLSDTADGIDMNDPSAKKMAILCSLSLYVDFVNLFIFLVRMFIRTKD
jgi:FtsH-binding integral membrane protein